MVGVSWYNLNTVDKQASLEGDKVSRGINQADVSEENIMGRERNQL